MTLSDVYKRYGDTRVYEGIDLDIKRGDRVSLAGPNGAGKSTLLRLLAGVLEIDRGERRPGHNVQVAFFAQHQLDILDPKRSVLEELGHGTRTEDIPRLRSHLGAFLFSGEDVEKKVQVLSGGEKARLALAKLLLRPSNFLVLDEPTNHLDVEACEVLEEALSAYTGTLAFVSHDRSFINALATRVVEVRRGRLRDFPGNYDDYLTRLEAAENPARAKPEHRRAGKSSPPALAPSSTLAPAEPASGPPSTTPSTKRSTKQARQRERERRKARERTSRQIARIEQEILDREREAEAVSWKLGAPEVYRDADLTRELSANRDSLRGEIESRYREWERLASELEALEDVPE